jgi:hypothetical protein
MPMPYPPELRCLGDSDQVQVGAEDQVSGPLFSDET